MSKNLDPRVAAIGRQLGAEIKRSQWRSVAAFTRALNDAGHAAEYTSMTKKANGSQPITMRELFVMLDMLGVDVTEFMNEAMAHHERTGKSRGR